MTRRGFSLIELVVVVVILGIIAAIAALRLAGAAQTSRINTTQANFVLFEKQIMLYQAEWQDWPPDPGTPGAFPTALAGYINQADWLRPAGITGLWDWPPVSMGPTRGVCVYNDGTADMSLWAMFDLRVDDNDAMHGVYVMNGPWLCRPLAGSTDGATGAGPIQGLAH